MRRKQILNQKVLFCCCWGVCSTQNVVSPLYIVKIYTKYILN